MAPLQGTGTGYGAVSLPGEIAYGPGPQSGGGLCGPASFQGEPPVYAEPRGSGGSADLRMGQGMGQGVNLQSVGSGAHNINPASSKRMLQAGRAQGGGNLPMYTSGGGMPQGQWVMDTSDISMLQQGGKKMQGCSGSGSDQKQSPVSPSPVSRTGHLPGIIFSSSHSLFKALRFDVRCTFSLFGCRWRALRDSFHTVGRCNSKYR